MDLNNKQTVELQYELEHIDDIEMFKKCNQLEFVATTLTDFLFQMLIKYNVERKDVIKRAELDNTYGYQIFDGRKSPKRNKIIQVSFGFPLTVEETQKALKFGGVNELYARKKRDAYLLFAIAKKMTIAEVNELLYNEGEELL